MAYDYRKLIGRIIEKFGSRANFAKAVNISEHSLSRKLNNKARLSQDEIAQWCELLEIPKESAYVYFFSQNGQYN